MAKMQRILFIFLLLSLCVIIQPVSAYIDPGVGSIIWQFVAALIFGFVFTIKMYWMKIKKIFTKTQEKTNGESD